MTDEQRRGHTLLDTDNAMTWASEFVRIFDGWIIRQNTWEDHDNEINEGAMVGWFANAIETGRAHPDHNTLKRCLIGNWSESYLNNAAFHYGIDFLAQAIPLWVDAMAESCAEEENRRVEAVRLMESGESQKSILNILADMAEGEDEP